MKPTSAFRFLLSKYSTPVLHTVLTLVLVGHFTVVAFSMLPANPISHQYKYQIQGYMNPWFSQTWNLFAPNPIASNQRLLFQYQIFQKGEPRLSGWVDVVEPLTDLKKVSYWSPVQRVLKHISASTNEVIETQNKAIKFATRQDTLAQDTAKTRRFLRGVIAQSSGHRAIMQYSRHTFRRMCQAHPSWAGADSVLVTYRVLNQEFPRFSKRETDYFNEKNSRYSHLTSEAYPLRLALR
ncbi:DUF5819 family protein [Hymenobacter psychrotolerans]|uniref:Uncharacterized protein n=1 Tax=Hymenobacter psychrotolerans DSM 18569 TaxID=1121959 RepID=A0A1M6VF19_9BACT|nr:DUF5819 family protein [Hymenobacter psychrotolerans]SHK80082.1 hypothetical protein SAMN02746009_01588 [Hymenobacter psychrotolerans DSM 18569]